MSRTKLKIIVIITLVTLVFIGISLGIKNKPKKFNIILIVVDALRANHLGCYGYSRNTSPNIDKFAKEGVLFTSAFSQGSLTINSITSLFTSLYPGVHKVLTFRLSSADKFTILPEILEENGYITAAFGGSLLRAIFNPNRSFKLYEFGDVRNPSALLITKEAVNWMKRDHNRPFFLYLHYLDVHGPYLPPPPYNAIFWRGKINDKIKDYVADRSRKIPHPPEPEAIRSNLLSNVNFLDGNIFFDYLVSQYDGEIKYVDDQIKILLGEIERLGLSKNTLVILTSDHGEEFLEHGRFLHETSLYDESIHIPLIMRLPEILPQDKEISNLVRHIDITPTILDMLGIRKNNLMQGISLLPVIRGKANPNLVVFSEVRPEGKQLIGIKTDKWKDSFREIYPEGRHLRGIRTKEWKYIETQDIKTGAYFYELYDLKNDPKELENVIERFPKEAEIFKTKLRNYLLTCARIRNSMLGEDFVDKAVTLDEETKEALKSLGYLQ